MALEKSYISAQRLIFLLNDSTTNWWQYNLMTTDNPQLMNTFSFDRLRELDSIFEVQGNPAYIIVDNAGKIIARPQSAVQYLKSL